MAEKREGTKFVANAKNGDRFFQSGDKVFIVNPNEPLRELHADGTITVVKLEPPPEGWHFT